MSVEDTGLGQANGEDERVVSHRTIRLYECPVLVKPFLPHQ